jgi:hypothetical protein
VTAGQVWLAAGFLASTASSNGGFDEFTVISTSDRFYFPFLLFNFWFLSIL